MRPTAIRWGLALVLTCAFVPLTAALTNPVIGILTQDDPIYLAASYVKYLESAGARVVPILHTRPVDELTALFGKINGFLIPGGGVDIANASDPFVIATSHLLQLAMAANNAGDYFPVWGTCMGFETLAVLLAADPNVLAYGFDSENLPLPLEYTSLARTSRLLGSLTPAIYSATASQNLTANFHQAGVTPAVFAGTARLSSFFNVLSTNMDRQGRAFVSTIEGKSMPVYGTQWHPEKNAFEWASDQTIPHDSNAVELCHQTARFFVDECRKSQHIYPADELVTDVIWNYNPVYTGKVGSHFEQEYIFS